MGLELVAFEDDSAPGAGGGNFYGSMSFQFFSLNNEGDTAFEGFAIGAGSGIWKEGSDLDLVALAGDIAPGTDEAEFGEFALGLSGLSDAGHMAFGGALLGSPNIVGIWKESSDPIFSVVALSG